ncbi:MAG: cytochrome D1 domain-containing protein, partial [Flavobacteriales bacterium]|nr:cytochrome D1 domain-containing protein [Flavobacteriales bacterium]
MKINRLFLLAIPAVLALVSCGDGGSTKNADDGGTDGSVTANGITLTAEEMAEASDIYFNTCAGCHGTLRKGATGPHLLPEAPEGSTVPSTVQLTTAGLKAFMMNGTPGGMPDWGKQGVLDDAQMDLVARFLQVPPPPIPAWTLEDMKKATKVVIPVADRPTKPMTNRNWKNYFGVILRDAGQVAIIDGDTKEQIAVIKTGFAVHILRTSATGRYFYSIGRDGKVTLIDLWFETPKLVAESKASFDARSVEVSKAKGFEDKYVIVGGYIPSHYVVFDALTLEPLKVIGTSGNILGNGEYLEEARVAAIVASHKDPIWVVNVKETGMVWLVDYSDLDKIDENTAKIPTAQFLHDGGWDESGRYFIVA